jgi:MbtH protein
MNRDDEDKRRHIVLVNEEDQYSLWLKDHAVPKGWRVVGPEGSREECLSYIGSVWTDMRPRSVRERDSKAQ